MQPFSGQTMRWFMEETTLVVILCKDPCNEIDELMLRELERLVSNLKQSISQVRALVFHSDCKRGFSAGADLRGLYNRLHNARKKLGLLNEEAPGKRSRAFRISKEMIYERAVRFQAKRFIDRIHRVFDFLDGCPFPTIAAVHGACFGGGFELALTCDFIVADKSTRFCFPELRLGLIPGFGGIPRLSRDVANALVRDLLFSGRSINAKKAFEIGLVSQVVARGEVLGAAKQLSKTSALFDEDVFEQAKKFAKPILTQALESEKQLFLEMVSSEKIFKNLQKFTESTDPRPYLPSKE